MNRLLAVFTAGAMTLVRLHLLKILQHLLRLLEKLH